MKILVIDNLDMGLKGDSLAELKEAMGEVPSEWEFRGVRLVERVVGADEMEWADKIVMTGSNFSLNEEFEWKGRIFEAMELILESGKPCFAVCFGAQVLARLLGAPVVVNSRGVEFGTVAVDLTELGAVYPYLKGVRNVLALHFDVIEELPSDCELLAYNANSPVQAFEYKNVFATQFHPDLPLWVYEKNLIERGEELKSAGLDFVKVRRELESGMAGFEVMRRFLLA